MILLESSVGTKFCIEKEEHREDSEAVVFADPTKFHKSPICQFACHAGYQNAYMLLVYKMIISPGSCKSFGLLNTFMSQSHVLGGQKPFFKKCFIAVYHHYQHMSW